MQSKSTVNVELDKVSRFPKIRQGYVPWTKSQAKRVREEATDVVADPEAPEVVPQPTELEAIRDKFNKR